MSYIRTAALVMVAASWIAVSQPASAVVLTFDDLPDPGAGLSSVPNGYGGLNWSNMGYMDPAARIAGGTNVPGYLNGTVSQPDVAFNGGGTLAVVSDGTFTFNGAYLTGAWNDNLNVTVIGKLGAAQLYSQTVVVNTQTPTFFNFNYVGIDTLNFSSSGGTPHGFTGGSGTQFAMDNFTINNVPEPSSVALLSVGAIGLAITARRRTRKRVV
jgi:hypothetical protein